MPGCRSARTCRRTADEMIEADDSMTRRDVLALSVALGTVLSSTGCDDRQEETKNSDMEPTSETEATNSTDNTYSDSMQIHYLEVVTKDVDETCDLYSAIHGVTFGDSDPSLGGARTCSLAGSGMLGVRAPMHDAEKSVSRAYVLVDDIKAAVEAAEKAGATIAVPPMPIPGHGTCAIYVQDGIEAGFWQL